MAPATLAGATPRAAQVRGRWDRDSIIDAIREWVATYGEPPRAADWNPSAAKWSGQPWRVARYRAGRADGTPWPALNSAKRPFGGSLAAAIRAAGFEPAKPGPKRRAGVDPEQAQRVVISPEGRAMIAAALDRARTAERALERARDRGERLARERDAARAGARRARRDGAAAAVAEPRRELATARVDTAEARTAANRLERSEATVAALRASRRELGADRDRLAAELAAAERLVADLRAQLDATPRVVVAPAEPPDTGVVDAARAAAAAARRRAEAAERRAVRAERELRETVAAVKGEPRRLTAAELAELRSAGPRGPAVMASALKALAAARASGGPAGMRAALTEVATAAITWRDRV